MKRSINSRRSNQTKIIHAHEFNNEIEWKTKRQYWVKYSAGLAREGGSVRACARAPDVVARNIHRIGAILWKREQEQAQRKSRCEDRAPQQKRAA